MHYSVAQGESDRPFALLRAPGSGERFDDFDDDSPGNFIEIEVRVRFLGNRNLSSVKFLLSPDSATQILH